VPNDEVDDGVEDEWGLGAVTDRTLEKDELFEIVLAIGCEKVKDGEEIESHGDDALNDREAKLIGEAASCVLHSFDGVFIDSLGGSRMLDIVSRTT